MPPSDSRHVVLAEVDEQVLDELVTLATTDASADEVTPPLTAGNTWTDTRVSWLRNYHRTCRAGLAGGGRESTWAVLADEGVVGSVRLKRTERPGVLETGIWLARGARGRGTAAAALDAVLARAATMGATAVRATTTATNRPALALLERAGFRLRPGDPAGSVHALLDLRRDPTG